MPGTAPAPEGRPIYFAGSLVFHLAALTLAIVLISGSGPDNPPEPNPRATERQVEAAHRSVQKNHEKRIEEKTAELESIERQLVEIERELLDRYEAMRKELEPGAPELAEDAVARALREQSEALENLVAAEEEFERVARFDLDEEEWAATDRNAIRDAFRDLGRMLDQAKAHQIAAAEAQADSANHLGLAGPAFAAARAAQHHAIDAQSAANRSHASAFEAVSEAVSVAREMPGAVRRLENFRHQFQDRGRDDFRATFEEQRDIVAEIAGRLAPAAGEARDALASARAAQRSALAAQRQVGDSELPGDAPPDPILERVDPVPSIALDGVPADWFQAAREWEGRAVGRFRNIRASDLALIRQVPRDATLALTDPAQRTAGQVDLARLASQPRTSGDMVAYREEVRKAQAEVDSLVAFGRQLLADAQRTAGRFGKGASVDLGIGSAASARALAAGAGEDDGQRAKDLSGYMRGLAGDGTRAGAGGKLPPPGPLPAAEAPGGDLQSARPGRLVAADGFETEWLSLDSWYVIGPFPNPDRRYVDRQFPPESIVDLDAVYEGKDRRPVSWEFVQTQDIPLWFDEEYSIYYAYTEVRSDAPRDIWLAIGSDDNARLWVNGLPVWKSGYQLKPWRINEGYRKVHLREGVNRFLVRIENGWGRGAFSVILRVR